MFDKYGCDVKSLSHMYRMVYLLGGIREGKSIDELFMIPENFNGRKLQKGTYECKKRKESRNRFEIRRRSYSSGRSNVSRGKCLLMKTDKS